MSEWWLSRGDGKTEGPLSTQALIQGLVAGRIPKQAYVCHVGEQTWLRVSQIDEIWEEVNSEPARTSITEQPWFMKHSDSGRFRQSASDPDDDRTKILTPLPVITPQSASHPLRTPSPRAGTPRELLTRQARSNPTATNVAKAIPQETAPAHEDIAALGPMRARVPTLDGISDSVPPVAPVVGAEPFEHSANRSAAAKSAAQKVISPPTTPAAVQRHRATTSTSGVTAASGQDQRNQLDHAVSRPVVPPMQQHRPQPTAPQPPVGVALPLYESKREPSAPTEAQSKVTGALKGLSALAASALKPGVGLASSSKALATGGREPMTGAAPIPGISSLAPIQALRLPGTPPPTETVTTGNTKPQRRSAEVLPETSGAETSPGTAPRDRAPTATSSRSLPAPSLTQPRPLSLGSPSLGNSSPITTPVPPAPNAHKYPAAAPLLTRPGPADPPATQPVTVASQHREAIAIRSSQARMDSPVGNARDVKPNPAPAAQRPADLETLELVECAFEDDDDEQTRIAQKQPPYGLAATNHGGERPSDVDELTTVAAHRPASTNRAAPEPPFAHIPTSPEDDEQTTILAPHLAPHEHRGVAAAVVQATDEEDTIRLAPTSHSEAVQSASQVAANPSVGTSPKVRPIAQSATKDLIEDESLLSDPSQLMEEIDDEAPPVGRNPVAIPRAPRVAAAQQHAAPASASSNGAAPASAVAPASAPPPARRPRLPSAPSIVFKQEPIVHQEATQPALRALRQSGLGKLRIVVFYLLAISLLALAAVYAYLRRG